MLLLLAAPRLDPEAGVAQARSQVVAERLELAQAKQARPVDGRLGRSDSGVHPAVGEGRDLDVTEIALEASDLRAEGATCDALVGGDLRGMGRAGPKVEVHHGGVEQLHLHCQCSTGSRSLQHFGTGEQRLFDVDARDALHAHGR